MQKYENLSTRDISKILVNVANDVSMLDPSQISKPLLEKCNIMLRVAKHGIQTIAVMTVVAKMRGLDGKIQLLPHVEISGVENYEEK